MPRGATTSIWTDAVAERIVRIGAGSGGRIDSPLGVEQHLASATPPDYLIFDHMAEAMMSINRSAPCRRPHR